MKRKTRVCQVSIQAQLICSWCRYVHSWQGDVYSADCTAFHAVFWLVLKHGIIKSCEVSWGEGISDDEGFTDTSVLTYTNDKTECHRQIRWGKTGPRHDVEMCLFAGEMCGERWKREGSQSMTWMRDHMTQSYRKTDRRWDSKESTGADTHLMMPKRIFP